MISREAMTYARGVFTALLLTTTPALAVKEPGKAAPAASAAATTGAVPSAADSASAEPATPSLWRQGPAEIELGNEVQLSLSDKHAYLPKEQAAKVLEANGSFHNEDVLGLVASAGHSDDWFVVIQYEPEGYVKDDESVDADDLLKDLREGNDEANKERKEKGFPPLTLEGWSDPPHYDKAQHQLVWSLIVGDPEGKSVNFNTRILGRKGFVSLTLVTDPTKLEAYKPDAKTLLTGTHFQKGARYEDFDSSKDKVAEYGLAGLIAAGAGLGAAKLIKIGLLAKFSKVIIGALIAGKKVIAVALVGAGAYLKKLFGNKDKGTGAGTAA